MPAYMRGRYQNRAWLTQAARRSAARFIVVDCLTDFGSTRGDRAVHRAGMWNPFRRRRSRATDLILERLAVMQVDITPLKADMAALTGDPGGAEEPCTRRVRGGGVHGAAAGAGDADRRAP